ncbi:DUF4280 domain-containing protein [Sinomicrobium soli]|uniref:DUF4280 domain-containing protein n=1 Tax=Sinomicrobium sp. N-1-3-6 TaxID=2219864 RepID=UPI000DCCBE40|nr:DUF4280 domain-containing protein [Sinomicrobium sp. N-1-3-6]RAV30763.1 DUF4280 domain-containing protein [Sinomicrobium sp. N-1-3-6]
MSSGKIVCQGALCECRYGDFPDTLQVVSKHKEYVNESDGSDKMIATHMDVGQPFEKKTFGQCKLQPTPGGYKPCQVQVAEWQDFYEKVTLSNGGKVLTEKSKATCPVAGAPCITVSFHGQTASPTSQQMEQADEETHVMLNPFAAPSEQREDKVEHLISAE